MQLFVISNEYKRKSEIIICPDCLRKFIVSRQGQTKCHMCCDLSLFPPLKFKTSKKLNYLKPKKIKRNGELFNEEKVKAFYAKCVHNKRKASGMGLCRECYLDVVKNLRKN